MQVTSYLMMGALSPGLKRHSVTLFEGDFCQCPIPQPACLSAAAILPPVSADRPSYLRHSCSNQGKISKVSWQAGGTRHLMCSMWWEPGVGH